MFVVDVNVDVFVTLDVVGGMVLVGWWWASGGQVVVVVCWRCGCVVVVCNPIFKTQLS